MRLRALSGSQRSLPSAWRSQPGRLTGTGSPQAREEAGCRCGHWHPPISSRSHQGPRRQSWELVPVRGGVTVRSRVPADGSLGPGRGTRPGSWGSQAVTSLCSVCSFSTASQGAAASCATTTGCPFGAAPWAPAPFSALHSLAVGSRSLGS